MKELVIDRIHTTKMGIDRIRQNLGLKDKLVHGRYIQQDAKEVMEYCKKQIQKATVERKGKNWYATTPCGEVYTVNVYSHTIITAHKQK